jgi:Ca2+-binding EF-hand superfamily protein
MRFEAFDVDESGFIPAAKWAEIMLAITGLRILWTPLIPSIVPPDAVSEGHCIDYMQFLRSLSTGNSEGENNLGAMYGPIDKLELIFNFFDKDGNGQISRAEFRAGCEFLNQSLPPDAQLKNIDEILGMMDLDGSDSIDRNELFEVSTSGYHLLMCTVIESNKSVALLCCRCSGSWMLRTALWTELYHSRSATQSWCSRKPIPEGPGDPSASHHMYKICLSVYMQTCT